MGNELSLFLRFMYSFTTFCVLALAHDCLSPPYLTWIQLADGDVYDATASRIPLRWTPPEAINYSKFSTASDVWSFGVFLHEVWDAGRMPYAGMSNSEVTERVERG